ncbi:MAG: hypothetical protein MR900_10320, partial [Prevotella sp.]|nr:hypothetical protein [Prevotella sp.]MDY5685681.1 hypothetical protein [Prevotella sp.]
ALQERVFTRLFEQAEISKFNPTELKLYEDSVNAYRDIVNAIKTAEKRKYAEGRAEGHADVARKLLEMNISVNDIAKATGLSIEEIERLRHH